MAEPTGLGGRLAALLDEARGRGVVSDYRQRGERQAAPAIGWSAEPHHQRQQYQDHIEAGELVKPLTLYVRGDEARLAQAVFSHLLLSQGNKKTTPGPEPTKAYRLVPGNAATGPGAADRPLIRAQAAHPRPAPCRVFVDACRWREGRGLDAAPGATFVAASEGPSRWGRPHMEGWGHRASALGVGEPKRATWGANRLMAPLNE